MRIQSWQENWRFLWSFMRFFFSLLRFWSLWRTFWSLHSLRVTFLKFLLRLWLWFRFNYLSFFHLLTIFTFLSCELFLQIDITHSTLFWGCIHSRPFHISSDLLNLFCIFSFVTQFQITELQWVISSSQRCRFRLIIFKLLILFTTLFFTLLFLCDLASFLRLDRLIRLASFSFSVFHLQWPLLLRIILCLSLLKLALFSSAIFHYFVFIYILLLIVPIVLLDDIILIISVWNICWGITKHLLFMLILLLIEWVLVLIFITSHV
jgi:hypothetical protein